MVAVPGGAVQVRFDQTGLFVRTAAAVPEAGEWGAGRDQPGLHYAGDVSRVPQQQTHTGKEPAIPVPGRVQGSLSITQQYIHRCSYVPMLEEFKIIDVLDELEPNLTSISPEVLAAFLLENADKVYLCAI